MKVSIACRENVNYHGIGNLLDVNTTDSSKFVFLSIAPGDSNIPGLTGSCSCNFNMKFYYITEIVFIQDGYEHYIMASNDDDSQEEILDIMESKRYLWTKRHEVSTNNVKILKTQVKERLTKRFRYSRKSVR
jgi:hypothetical protein